MVERGVSLVSFNHTRSRISSGAGLIALILVVFTSLAAVHAEAPFDSSSSSSSS